MCIYTYLHVSTCLQVSRDGPSVGPIERTNTSPAQTSGGLGGGRQVSYKERPPPATCRH